MAALLGRRPSRRRSRTPALRDPVGRLLAVAPLQPAGAHALTPTRRLDRHACRSGARAEDRADVPERSSRSSRATAACLGLAADRSALRAADATKGELIPQEPDGRRVHVDFAKLDLRVCRRRPSGPARRVADTGRLHAREPPTSSREDVRRRARGLRRDAAPSRSSRRAMPHERLAISTYGYQDPKDRQQRRRSASRRACGSRRRMRDGTIVSTPLNDLVDRKKRPALRDEHPWTGFEHPYILLAASRRSRRGCDGREAHVRRGRRRPDAHGHHVPAGHEPGRRAVPRSSAYLGPKNYTQPRRRPTPPAGFSTGFTRRRSISAGSRSSAARCCGCCSSSTASSATGASRSCC